MDIQNHLCPQKLRSQCSKDLKIGYRMYMDKIVPVSDMQISEAEK